MRLMMMWLDHDHTMKKNANLKPEFMIHHISKLCYISLNVFKSVMMTPIGWYNEGSCSFLTSLFIVDIDSHCHNTICLWTVGIKYMEDDDSIDWFDRTCDWVRPILFRALCLDVTHSNRCVGIRFFCIDSCGYDDGRRLIVMYTLNTHFYSR